ncbi:unnamed protein product [Closterium sp. NIES-54]
MSPTASTPRSRPATTRPTASTAATPSASSTASTRAPTVATSPTAVTTSTASTTSTAAPTTAPTATSTTIAAASTIPATLALLLRRFALVEVAPTSSGTETPAAAAEAKEGERGEG